MATLPSVADTILLLVDTLTDQTKPPICAIVYDPYSGPLNWESSGKVSDICQSAEAKFVYMDYSREAAEVVLQSAIEMVKILNPNWQSTKDRKIDAPQSRYIFADAYGQVRGRMILVKVWLQGEKIIWRHSKLTGMGLTREIDDGYRP